MRKGVIEIYAIHVTVWAYMPFTFKYARVIALYSCTLLLITSLNVFRGSEKIERGS